MCAVYEAALAHIGEATNQHGAIVGINDGESTEMLTHLFQVGPGAPLSLHDGGHATPGCPLQPLATVEGVALFVTS